MALPLAVPTHPLRCCCTLLHHQDPEWLSSSTNYSPHVALLRLRYRSPPAIQSVL